MDIEKFKILTSQYTQRQVASILNCSQGKVKYWVAKLNLKIEKEISCKICGEKDVTKFYKHKSTGIRYRCKNCDNKETIKRFRRYKKEAVDYKGGKCSICGYDKCLGSLDFHHINRSEKDINWSKMRNWPLEKIKKELDKCKLVCRNCHGEIHYKDFKE